MSEHAEQWENFSAAVEYRVENDTVGLREHLGETVEPVEIKYSGDIKADKAAYEEKRGKKMSDVAYYREAITDALMGLAAKYPEGMEIGKTGYRVMLPQTKGKARRGQGKARTSKRLRAVSGLEEVIHKGVHLGSTEAQIDESTGRKKRWRLATAQTFEKFGYPVRLNGEEMLFWFNGIAEKEGEKEVDFYEFGVTEVEDKEAGETVASAINTNEGSSPSFGETIGEFLSRVKNKNVVDVKKVGDGGVSMSVEEAEGRGMFGGDGVMVAGNGFVARPGVNFSAAIEGAQHASPHLFKAFDTAHMGEGEGNQAYGWGLYFSTNWGVNKWYWSKFSSGKMSLIVNGEILAQGVPRQTFMRILAERYAADKKLELTEYDKGLLPYMFEELVYDTQKRTYAELKAIHEKWKKVETEEGRDTSYRDKCIEALNYLIDNDVKIERPRAVDYLVDLDVEEEELLPWEGKVGDLIGRNKRFEGELRKYMREELGRMLVENYEPSSREEEEKLKERFRAHLDKEVEQWMEQTKEKDGAYYYKELVRELGGQKKASEWLLAHGIKGIKFWDGPSRRKERGFYNYVIFDGGDVKIRKINNRGEWTSDVGAGQWENFSAAVEVMTDEELSSAVVGIDDRVMGILRARDAEEAMGARIAAEWGKFARAVSLSTASGDEWRAEDGARLMGKMLGLVAATRRFLPEEYGVARGMHQMLAWAKWYAQVLESGEVKRTDMLRGDIYEKALAGMRREVEGMRGRLTPGEVEGWLRGQMGQRLDVMLLKMAGICRGQVERYEKEQIRRRMMDMAERLYPKMEPGEHIKRGKATADTYRYIERVVRTLRGDMWWRSGAAAAEMEAALQAKLARVDLDPKVREVVERELEELVHGFIPRASFLLCILSMHPRNSAAPYSFTLH